MAINWKAIIATAAGVGLAGYGVSKLFSKKASNDDEYVEVDDAEAEVEEVDSDDDAE